MSRPPAGQLGVERMHLPIAWQDHIEILKVEIGDALGWDQCDQARTTLGFPAGRHPMTV